MLYSRLALDYIILEDGGWGLKGLEKTDLILCGFHRSVVRIFTYLLYKKEKTKRKLPICLSVHNVLLDCWGVIVTILNLICMGT